MIKRRKNSPITLTNKTVFNTIIFLMLIYFIFHSIYGSRGIISYFQLQSELEKSHIQLEKLRSERLDAENRTKLLRPESLDKDMLDEQVRNVLGLSKVNEKIFKKQKIEE